MARFASPWIEAEPARVVERALWIVLAGLAVWHSAALACMADDAYISFRYARNLVGGQGLVYNAGERVEGYTNFLWVVLIAGGLKLGVSAEFAATVLGALSLGGAFAASTSLLRRILGDGRGAMLLAALLASAGPLLLWSFGGLETGLFTALVVAGVERTLRSRERPRALFAAGALFGTATLVRPDAVVLAAVAFAGALASSRASGRLAAALRFAAGFCPIVLPWFAWRVWWYGSWLPNSFYVKSTSAGLATLGGRYARDFVLEYPLLFVATCVAALVGSFHPRWRSAAPAVRTLAAALALWTAYVVRVGGDYMALYRFFAPVLPLAAVLIVVGVSPWLGAGVASWKRALASSAPFLVAAASLLPSRASLREDFRTRSVEPVAQQRARVAQWVTIGKLLGERLPRDAVIAVSNCGAIPYFADRRTIDQSGLCDRYTARERSDPWVLDFVGHRLQATRAYLEERQPDLILWRPTVEWKPVAFACDPPSPEYATCSVVLRTTGTPAAAPLYLSLWVRRSSLDRWGDLRLFTLVADGNRPALVGRR